ncbi:hypothetical protein TIFTF001_018698 [Ficus carica]|uniref:Uncharacterized protein n=1 Tax=Ficus carica TaxID=3494 RepID=A0AA88DBY2_FICCA|nr:hypothetical protein TIFTF001_018698 [Ficus carica]
MKITMEMEIECRRSPCLISLRMEIRISKASQMPSPELADEAPTPSLAPSLSTVEDPGLSSHRHYRSLTVAVFAATCEFVRSQKPVTTHVSPSRHCDPSPHSQKPPV